LIKQVIHVSKAGIGGGIGIHETFCKKYDASVVIKNGSGSGDHALKYKQGKHDYTVRLSNFGCGTLLDIPTYFAEDYLLTIEPLLNDIAVLRDKDICKDPMKLLYIDKKAIAVLPYHTVLSRTLAMAAQDTSGTCGSGSGKAYVYAKEMPELAVYAGDFSNMKTLRAKLVSLRSWVRMWLKPFTVNSFTNESDRRKFLKYQELLFDPGDKRLDLMVEELHYLGTKLTYKSLPEILEMFDGTAVVEMSHGILADSELGFQPYVCDFRTIPQVFDKKLRTAGFKGKIRHFIVHRAYQYRHGPSPMPTCDKEYEMLLGMSKKKEENRWRGSARYGYFDMLQLAYAIECCGGPKKVDGLCITCFDHVMSKCSSWDICEAYRPKDEGKMLLPYGGKLTTESFDGVKPFICSFDFPKDKAVFKNKRTLFEFVDSSLRMCGIEVPLKLLSCSSGSQRRYWREDFSMAK